jgi:hypothetical protein
MDKFDLGAISDFFKMVDQKFITPLTLSEFHKNRASFYEELAKSIESKEQFKVFLTEELKIARDPKTRDGARARALGLMLKSLSKGDDFRLSTIIGAGMPKSDSLMLIAVDYSKNKVDTFRIMAASLREQGMVKSIIQKAIIPPMILVPGIGGFSWVMATQSLPIMIKMAPPKVWTPFNQSVRSFCEYIAQHGVLTFIAVGVAVSIFSYLLSRWSGFVRSRLEQVPVSTGMLLFPICPILVPLSIYRDFQVSILFSSMAVLLQSGMTLNECIRALVPNASPWLRWHLNRILLSLHNTPSEYISAFSKGLLGSSLLAKLSSSIRHTSHFDKLVIKLGTTEGEQIRKQIEKVTKTMNALLLVVMGAVIMYLYVGQFSISNDLTDALSSRGAR